MPTGTEHWTGVPIEPWQWERGLTVVTPDKHLGKLEVTRRVLEKLGQPGGPVEVSVKGKDGLSRRYVSNTLSLPAEPPAEPEVPDTIYNRVMYDLQVENGWPRDVAVQCLNSMSTHDLLKLISNAVGDLKETSD